MKVAMIQCCYNVWCIFLSISVLVIYKDRYTDILKHIICGVYFEYKYRNVVPDGDSARRLYSNELFELKKCTQTYF